MRKREFDQNRRENVISNCWRDLNPKFLRSLSCDHYPGYLWKSLRVIITVLCIFGILFLEWLLMSGFISIMHDDVIKWNHFPRYWPFVRGIHRSPVNSLHKGQWRGALMFSLICAWINGYVNNREAGDLRRLWPRCNGFLVHHSILMKIYLLYFNYSSYD